MKFFSQCRAVLPFRRSSARIWVLSLVLLLTAVVDTAEAVSVSPTALYIDSRTRTGVMTLHNPGSLPEEITIGFAFGYPISDANGLVSVQLLDEAPAGEPSAAEWMRVFPRRLILQPGQRQVIRVMVQPPADLPDGEYWARIIISSRGGQPPIEQTDGNVSLQLNVETVLVMAANYRQGAVSAGVEITGASAQRTEDGVSLELDMQRTGNAAALGRVLVELLDAQGSVVATTHEDIAVYRTMRRRLLLAVPENASGPLGIRIRIVPEREDLPAASILNFASVTHSLAVLP
ncbi:hypothetical protein BH23GEM8_BH23GEM8_05500 [soil metagenome]